MEGFVMKSATQFIAALILSAITAQPAFAAACVSQGEVRAGLRFLAPTMIKAVRTKCMPTLGPDAYLTTKGEALISRYQAPDSPPSPELSSLFKKIFGSDAESTLPDGFVSAVAVGALVEGVQKDLKPTICPDIDQALALIDPLPADNMVGLLELIVTRMAQDDAKKTEKSGRAPKFTLCAQGAVGE
jgi:hypothetical protein